MAIIYKPKGAAGEYAVYAANFFNGCSNGCKYCYNKRGLTKNVCGRDKPVMKKGYKDEDDLFEHFCEEVNQNWRELAEHELFLSFTTDPWLPECKNLTKRAIEYCQKSKIHCYVLSKLRGDELSGIDGSEGYIHIGVTLTGHDEMEPNADSNYERMKYLQEMHERGFDTFVSLEPIIDFDSAKEMVWQCCDIVNEIRIGLMSPAKKGRYERHKMQDFVSFALFPQLEYCFDIMWKSSFRLLAQEYNIELTENHNLYGRKEINRLEIGSR